MSRARRKPQLQEVSPWRRQAVLCLFAACTSAVLLRGFELQVLDREFLQREGERRAVRTLAVEAHRGAIRDRNGEPLALSAPVESLWAVPGALLEAPQFIAPLARLLDQSPEQLRSTLEARSERQFAYLRRHMNPADATRVLQLGAPGVFASREYRRYYPAGEVASHVVGFTDIDGRGQEGMEAALDARLRGTPGARRVVRARDGRIVDDGLEYREAQPGQDVRLTLDLRLQYLAYRELKRAVVEQGASGGLIVVADVNTGEILAAANQPGFNPNRSEDRSGPGVRNRTVVDVFEPGSSIKTLLVAHGLDTGALRPDHTVDTEPGFYRVGRLTVRDVNRYGVVDLTRMLSKSSNVGAARIGLEMGPEAVFQGYQRFGVGDPLYSGFPGEGTGVFRPWLDWGQIGTATAAYGYGLSLTALHLVRAYAALGNDGLMPQLRFAEQQFVAPPQRAVSAGTALAVRRLLEAVVSADGTGQRAAVPGYRVAGKTGTVRKVGPGGYDGNRHQALFIGMVPAERPRLVALVMIDEPRNDAYYGGQVAAPVFARVMQGAVRMLQVAPDPPYRTLTADLGRGEPRL